MWEASFRKLSQKDSKGSLTKKAFRKQGRNLQMYMYEAV